MGSAVYLIHFDSPFKHAQHYLGWAKDVEARFRLHAGGRGCRLLKFVNEGGIDYHIVRRWQSTTRILEFKFKKWHDNKILCPICQSERKKRKLETQRNRRRLAKPDCGGK